MSDTQVGDEGIAKLDKLKKLKYVYANATTISEFGEQRFQQAHPDAHLHLQR